jgi:RNA polymerase sigma-70 factor, ECF subfamily
MNVDETVAERLARGDAAGAATLALEAHGPSVLRYLRSLLDEDVAQDAFSRFAEDLWRGLPGFRRECSLRAWAFRVAWHGANKEMRDPYRRRGERLPTGAASRLAASIVRSSALAGGGRREKLRVLRASLDPEEQTLLTLRIDRELEWDEVAAVLATEGAPVRAAALRKRFERLKSRLGQLAREQGLVDAPRSAAAKPAAPGERSRAALRRRTSRRGERRPRGER